MTFLNLGLALAGLACVAIPILIHLLFRKRRKPIEWAAMRFLLEAYRKQRKRLTLEQIILLACRCLVIACVAVALGRPVLSALGLLGSGAARTLYIAIDNSLAASTLEDDGKTTALDRHKEDARQALRVLGDTDRAGLVFLGAPADPIVVPASADIPAVIETIDAIQPTDAAADIAGALTAIASAATDAQNENQPDADADRVVLILSDFLQGAIDPAQPAPGLGEALSGAELIIPQPRADAPGNTQIIAIDPLRSLFFTSENEGDVDTLSAGSVRVELRRTGPAIATAQATEVRLRVDTGRAAIGQSQEIGRAVARWSPGQETASIAVAINPGVIPNIARNGAAAIVAEIDRDAVEGDNTFRLPIEVRDKMRVGVLARRRFTDSIRVDRLSAGEWLALALNPTDESAIDVRTIDPASIDAATLAGLDVVLAPRPDLIDAEGWRRLRVFVDAGGLLTIFPPSETTVHLWTDAAQRELGMNWTLARETLSHEPPLTLDDEQPATPMLTLLAGEFAQLTARVHFFQTLPIQNAPAGAAVLRFQDGAPFIVADRPGSAAESAAAPGRGLVVCFTSAPMLAWTDLPAKPLMVPLINEIIREGVAQARGDRSAIAGASPEAPPRTTELTDADEADAQPITITPGGRTAAPIRRAGLFQAIDDRGAPRGLVAVNADPDAGRTNTNNPAAIETWFTDAGFAPGSISMIDPDSAGGAFAQALADDDASAASSLPYLIAALIFAVLETMLARWFSHASIESRATAAPALSVANTRIQSAQPGEGIL
ncbi:MAG: BatA domain-containing protein [Phycisphaeraceae bacterium]|nr:BatA domain-containing protein [Phycisphaeraceae bacterium]MCB9847162.1 BatA domain-containing protein [Phycisphaeraceae bacterium]